MDANKIIEATWSHKYAFALYNISIGAENGLIKGPHGHPWRSSGPARLGFRRFQVEIRQSFAKISLNRRQIKADMLASLVIEMSSTTSAHYFDMVLYVIVPIRAVEAKEGKHKKAVLFLFQIPTLNKLLQSPKVRPSMLHVLLVTSVGLLETPKFHLFMINTD